MLARVAELEDAVDLKSIVRKGVWVRVPPRACLSQAARELHHGSTASPWVYGKHANPLLGGADRPVTRVNDP
jgi:hypothetical protein